MAREPRRLLDAAAAAVYAPSGHLLFARENQLLAQRFDPATLTLSGEPFKVADNVGVNRGVSLATLAASSAGAIAYATAAPCGCSLRGSIDRARKSAGLEHRIRARSRTLHCRRTGARSHSRD